MFLAAFEQKILVNSVAGSSFPIKFQHSDSQSEKAKNTQVGDAPGLKILVGGGGASSRNFRYLVLDKI